MDWKKRLQSRSALFFYVVLAALANGTNLSVFVYDGDGQPVSYTMFVVPLLTFVLSSRIAWILREAWQKTHEDLAEANKESARVREVGICALRDLLLSAQSFAHLAIGESKGARGLHDRRRASVHNFLIGAENLGMTSDEVLSVIKESGADVLFLQDVAVRWRNGRGTAALLPWADALVAYVHRTPTSLTPQNEAAFLESLKQK